MDLALGNRDGSSCPAFFEKLKYFSEISLNLQQLQLEALGKHSTWKMYRRKLKVLNRNKLIVFVDQHFGIFPSHEVFMLANVPVHDIAKELNITRDQVHAKYTEELIIEKS